MRKINWLFAVFVWFSVGSAWANESAPDFSLDGLQGKVNLSDFKGKIVYVDFWASWCVPCRKSFPWMNTVFEKYKDKGLVVVGINLDNKRSLADTFLKEVPASFAIAFDPEGKIADAYKVKGMPSSYIIDRNGTIIKTHLGFRSKDTEELEKSLQAALASN